MNTPDPTDNPCSNRLNRSLAFPDWQTPKGVTKANWEYVRANHIADQYDDFLQGDPLTTVDRKILDRYFPAVASRESAKADLPSDSAAPVIADFGCGSGRSLLPLLENGYRGIGVDLSLAMLRAFQQKVSEHARNLASPLLIQANLVELGMLKDDSIDHGICMFSTLGMISRNEHRRSFLAHVRRILKPGGRFIVHAHNVWFQLRYPGGWGYVLKNSWFAFRGKSEFGDRTANYRSIGGMFIHSFRKSELRRELCRAGLVPQEWYGIQPDHQSTESEPSFTGGPLRTVGWIVVCR